MSHPSFLQDIKAKFNHSSIVEKLIYINIAVFVLGKILNIFSPLEVNNAFLSEWFAMSEDLKMVVLKPWTVVSYGFVHLSFVHLLYNAIALYYIGNLFLDFFSQRQLFNYYIFGTVFGGLLSLTYFNVTETNPNAILIGASAGVTAIFVGIAAFIPNYAIRIPLIGFIKLWVLAAIWVGLDFVQFSDGNTGGHLAHLGGALFGYLAVKKPKGKSASEGWFSKLFQRKGGSLKTVYKSKHKKEQYGNNKTIQRRTDEILDKISKSGYDTLSAEEKDFLFRQQK